MFLLKVHIFPGNFLAREVHYLLKYNLNHYGGTEVREKARNSYLKNSTRARCWWGKPLIPVFGRQR